MFDMYHLQKNEECLIYHIDLLWDEIGYFQISDEPSCTEPATVEINFKNVFKHIYHKQKETVKNFILGMEHFKSKEGIENWKWIIFYKK